MDPSAPSSGGLIGWVVVLVLGFLVGGLLVVYQRDRISRPPRGEGSTVETSIPHLSLEELARDFRKPARERRYKGQLVEVTGFVVGEKIDGGRERAKPTLLVHLAPERGAKALLYCACSSARGLPVVRPGEELVIQGTVDIVLSEGSQQAGLVDARIVRRVSE